MLSGECSNLTRVLALEPYYGGSHQAFVEGWSSHSRHRWTILGLPSHHWKWRMRHAPLTMAAEVRQRVAAGEQWDVLLCSDMLNLAEFRGLAPDPVGKLPAVAYFHENQLTYPVRVTDTRDHHFSFSNLMTAVAADQVWFNSQFHRDEFLSALRGFLQGMPDYQPIEYVDHIAEKSSVFPPGVEPFPAGGDDRRPGPLSVLWAARWEHDKNPEVFFSALDLLEQRGVDFRISVIGQSFRQTPDVFETAHSRWKQRIKRWGFQPSRATYLSALLDADVFVSTADHEFFGIAAVEAMAAGAFPLLPRRLSYPELLNLDTTPSMSQFFYDGSAYELADRLQRAAELVGDRQRWRATVQPVQDAAARFSWGSVVEGMDAALERLATT